jgi:DNA polymerase-3 subunit delta'
MASVALAPLTEPSAAATGELASILPGIDAHPHARAVLAPALPPRGHAAHAYLFHGPPGSGKRTIARAFAAALLADGARAPDSVARRVAHGTHPDLTWVTPSGAAEMLVGDIDEPVVAAAARTPFESARRVFVIEDAHTLNDQAASKLLKTLEEPPTFVHLLLLTNRVSDVLPTIASRCSPVRFDPLPAARIAPRLDSTEQGTDGSGAHAVAKGRSADGGSADRERPSARAQACARLSLGDARLAARLASAEGEALRSSAEGFVRSSLGAASGERRWLALLERARAAGERAGEESRERVREELELLPAKERRRHEREGGEAQRRVERRARTRTLDLALRLAELWLRDLLCLSEGAPELVYAVDRRAELAEDARGREPGPLREALALVADTRLRLSLNVSEELALEALAYRLEALLSR